MRLRLFPFTVGVLLYNLAASLLAWRAGWPPQLGGNPDPEQPYLSYLFQGSAISAPLPPVIALLVGGWLSRKGGAWRMVGLTMAGIVGVLFIIGAFGEFVADHPHVPMEVVYGFGTLYLSIGLALLGLVAKEARSPDSSQRQ